MGNLRELADAAITVTCPSCGHALEKKGSWVRAVGGYTCRNCNAWRQLSYSEKNKLFADHARLNRRLA